MRAPLAAIFKTRSGAALFAAAAAFVLSNILLDLHASKYGDEPHEHNGQACVLTLAAPGGHKVIETSAFVFVALFAVWRISNHIAQSERAHILVRAARPRGPPSL